MTTKPEKRKKWLWVLLILAGLWVIGAIGDMLNKPSKLSKPPPRPAQTQWSESATPKPTPPSRVVSPAKPKALPPKIPTPLEKQFSSWDGSHYNTVRYIKRLMHDPKTFKHVSTFHLDSEDKKHRIIYMTYRGSNAFGATVRNTTAVKVDLNGKVVGIVK